MFAFPMFLNSKATCFRHNVYKDIWTPTLREKLSTVTEPENHHDKYVVKVLKENEVVGHVPCDISKYCTSALLYGGTIKRLQGKNKTNVETGLKSRVNTW